MPKSTILIAQDLADGTPGDWADIPHSARGVELMLNAKGGASLTAELQVQDALGAVYAYHTETFAADGTALVELADFPHQKARVALTLVGSGTLDACLAMIH